MVMESHIDIVQNQSNLPLYVMGFYISNDLHQKLSFYDTAANEFSREFGMFPSTLVQPGNHTLTDYRNSRNDSVEISRYPISSTGPSWYF